jgi:predicted amidohydrolase YtcJ
VKSARKRRLVLFVAGLLIGATARTEEVDLLFTNGNIYTVAAKQPKAEAVAVKAGRIVSVGSNDDAKNLHAAEVVDLNGRAVVPGFTDSHCHIFGIGEREMRLNLEGTNLLEDFLARVKERVEKTGHGKWITGRGWIETFWKPPEFPTRQDLVAKNIPKATQAEREEALLRGIDREVKLGWCEIQNAASHKEDIGVIQKAFQAGKIKIRFANAVYGPGQDAQNFLREGPTINAFDHHFTQRTIKVLFDGALGSRGAALLKPYCDAPETSGLLREKPEDLRPMFEEALRRGIQVETHALGDRANRLILDLYEQAFKAVPADERKIREPRWRIEHAQIVDPNDIPRFAKLGVIPSMQPSHAISDLFFAPARLGMDRLVGAHAWQTFLKSGCIIAGGSDAPVERGEPMIEFYAAVARKSVHGESGQGWHPEQAVSREDALKMFTIWPAYAAFEEKDKGSIEVGKLADFTVLSQDIMKIPEMEILETRNEMTVIGGEIIYSR